jgi:hypothetical protein
MAMNSEYKRTRFIATPPPGGFPSRFGVITACNPDGRIVTDEENAASTAKLRQHLIETEMVFFPVTGCSPDLVHREPGFGVTCEADAIVELGQAWNQEAVFWVEAGIVHLVPCGAGEPATLGTWMNLVHQSSSG